MEGKTDYITIHDAGMPLKANQPFTGQSKVPLTEHTVRDQCSRKEGVTGII